MRDEGLYHSGPALGECCGVFGVRAPGRPVAGLAHAGILALQHRGQEAAGIAVLNQNVLSIQKGRGLVDEVFRHFALPESGECALGHVLYAGKGGYGESEPLPLWLEPDCKTAISLNGKLLNYWTLRCEAERMGRRVKTFSDAEIILHTIASQPPEDLRAKIISALGRLEGAFSFIIMAGDRLFAVRDAYGRKPLCYASLGEGQVAASSESCALDTIGAKNAVSVLPGEMIVADQHGVEHISYSNVEYTETCVFEYIYLARPDSVVDGQSVWRARYNMGRRLALECGFDADIVVPVPSSGVAAAMGYSYESGIPFQEGLVKNQFIGRTFLLPSQAQREMAVQWKMNPIRENLAGKRIILVDDSIVRGTTMRRLIAMIKECGPKQIFLAISSPPLVNVCAYGVDITSPHELIAVQYCEEEIPRRLGCDGLHYLSKEGLLSSLNRERRMSMCMECFSAQEMKVGVV